MFIPIRLLALISTAPIILSILSCNQGVNVLDVVPQIVYVGPITYDGGNQTITVVYSVRDYEEDPVDILITYVDSNGYVQENFTETLQSHGRNGVTSSSNRAGKEHIFVWDVSQVELPETLQFQLTPVDVNGAKGSTVTTPFFNPREGLKN
jgi:hypothetical protein